MLDDLNLFKKINQSKAYNTIIEYSKQCEHAFVETQNINVPDDYRNIKNLVMCGMGGSGLAGRIIESIYGFRMNFPMVRVNDYSIPKWANTETLVICSSFSGSTEETITNAKEAINQKCKLMVICAGGELLELAKSVNAPYYLINPTYNPSKQPRMAIGYSVIGQLMLASKAGVINFPVDVISKLKNVMDKIITLNAMDVNLVNNPAKLMAQKIYDKCVIFVASRHLLGAVHTVKNQLNENDKNFSCLFDIPELNHHLMEGLINPKSNKANLMFVFINSNLYPDRIRQRYKITSEIVNKLGIPYLNWEAQSSDLLTQSFEFIQFGGLVNFYLNMLYEIDPAEIPWVDYFKNKLGQPLGDWK